MEDLPLLVLETVCENLAHCEPKRGSPFAFSSTSKTSCAAAGRERFSRLLLRTDDEDQFQHDLVRLEHLLETATSRKYVRILKVYGNKVDEDEDKDGEAEDPFSILPKSHVDFYGAGPFVAWTPGKRTRKNESWKPFADFLSGLALKDLIWASTEQVPRCILSALHEQNPTCRLHVHTFSLRSLYQDDGLQNIDDAEYLLATSPCLYSIIGPYSAYDAIGRANYNDEGMLQMVAESAPRLKHVRM